MERLEFDDGASRVVSILDLWTVIFVVQIMVGGYHLIMSVISFVAFQ